jgi:tRNA C32,U32 (ribose-2'-O)-methylase TrmJ
VITRLPTDPDFGTLNISNAAAIALYEARRSVAGK